MSFLVLPRTGGWFNPSPLHKIQSMICSHYQIWQKWQPTQYLPFGTINWSDVNNLLTSSILLPVTSSILRGARQRSALWLRMHILRMENDTRLVCHFLVHSQWPTYRHFSDILGESEAKVKKIIWWRHKIRFSKFQRMCIFIISNDCVNLLMIG